MYAHRLFTFVVLSAVAMTSPAAADGFDFAIDFDTDGDPSTIQSTVEASVGDIVEAYLVVNDFLTPWPDLWAVMFGVDATAGLELTGLYGTQSERGGMLTDGSDGVVLAYTTPFRRWEVPMFAARLLFRVTALGDQTVKLAPSTGWGVAQTGVVWTVSEEGGPLVDVTDSGALVTQRAGTIVPRDPLPIQSTTWTKIKKLYQDDTI